MKKPIKIYSKKEGNERRNELFEQISKSDVHLPEDVLHEDLDKGMLDFVSNELEVISSGQKIPVNKVIFTLQRWAEFTQTWDHVDQENNVQLPIITVVRKPDPQPGSHPTLMYTIPERKTFHYITVPKWDGNVYGADVYKIPQPVAIDIYYEIIIVCDKLRELNRFNKVVLQKFSSRQAYAIIKGHYIPIILESVSDESPIDNLEGRRFYQQVYTLMLQGFLIDSEEFEVVPAISRSLIITETMKENCKVSYLSTKTVDLHKAELKGDGNQTVFSVGEKIGLLLGVMIDGMLQERGINYNHIEGTSNITFVATPNLNNNITVLYVSKKNARLYEQTSKLKFSRFAFVTNGNTSFQLESYLDIVYITKNGFVLNPSDYTYHDTGILVFNTTLSNTDKINVYSFTK